MMDLLCQIMRSMFQRVIFCFFKGTLRASSRLHEDLFQKILRSPMKFFDTTPTARILNRFSKDMDEGGTWWRVRL